MVVRALQHRKCSATAIFAQSMTRCAVSGIHVAGDKRMALGLESFASVLDRVKTPLTLAGLALLIFYGALRRILDLEIWASLREDNTAALLGRILSYTFILAVICVLLGVTSFLVMRFLGPDKS